MNMILNEDYSLSNGVAIPKLGLGTWLVKNENAGEVVQAALELGYRHIDTAQAYGNERGVAQGLQAAGKRREEIFVTTKLAAEIKSYDEALKAIDGSLEKLGLEHIDLMIIHSPKPWAKFKGEERYFEGNQEAWRALEAGFKAGKLRAIGLSNFEKPDVENILNNCTVKPVINQVLAHISNTPFELIDYCKAEDILVEAYSPIGHGELLKNEALKQMAANYSVSVAQLGIRYCLQLGLLPLPKTTNADHMKTNAALDFEISEEDMQQLQRMKKIEHYGEASKFPIYA